MELKTLEYFLTIARYENITQAARDLHISQPPLSRSLQALEEELGVPLFRREKKRLHLTEEGRYFRRQCLQIQQLLDHSVQQVRQMKQGTCGKIYIGSVGSAGSRLIPSWIAGFGEQYPQVSYNIWSGNTDDVVERMRQGLLDAAVIREPFDQENFESLRVGREPWAVLVKNVHPLAAGSGSLKLRDLAGQRLIISGRRSTEIRRWFADQGLQADVFCEYDQVSSAIGLVRSNLGILICPGSTKDTYSFSDLAWRQLEEGSRSSWLSLIWRSDVRLSPLAETFVTYIKQQLIPADGVEGAEDGTE